MKSFRYLNNRKGSLQANENNQEKKEENKFETMNVEDQKNLHSQYTKKFIIDENIKDKIFTSNASPSRLVKHNQNQTSPKKKNSIVRYHLYQVEK